VIPYNHLPPSFLFLSFLLSFEPHGMYVFIKEEEEEGIIY